MSSTFKIEKCYERILRDGYQDDLTLLAGALDVDEIGNILKARFLSNDIYTSIGPVLIALNPYKLIRKEDVSIYDSIVARIYQNKLQFEIAPHIYGISAAAYNFICDVGSNTCIIVTGESGAGKTEAAKQLMKYITTICSVDTLTVHHNAVKSPKVNGSGEDFVYQLDDYNVDSPNVNKARYSFSNNDDDEVIKQRAREIINDLLDTFQSNKTKKVVTQRQSLLRENHRKLSAIFKSAHSQSTLMISSDDENENGRNKHQLQDEAQESLGSSNVNYDIREAFNIICNSDLTVTCDNMLTLQCVNTSIEELKITKIYIEECFTCINQQFDDKVTFELFVLVLRAIEIEIERNEICLVRNRKSSAIFDYFAISMQTIAPAGLEEGFNSQSGDGKLIHNELTPSRSHSLKHIHKQIMHSNIVLEAFGNSQTIRNDNSSRFGKYLELQFNRHTKMLVGGQISTYLLEKSRIIHHNQMERNFHVLHYIVHHTDLIENDKYLLKSCETYNYMNYTDNVITNVDDNEKFIQLKQSMEIIGLNNIAQFHIFKLLSGILSLGNIIFDEANDDDTKATVTKNIEWLNMASYLLSVDQQDLLTALVTHKLQASNPMYENESSSAASSTLSNGNTSGPRRVTFATQHLNRKDATANRDSLAKELYNRLFKWIVNAINIQINANLPSKEIIFMGILDIYGFEVFQDNSFEQLCINWANEKLQQYFIELTLGAEQLEYQQEGLKWEMIGYINNKAVVDLIEQKTGIITLLDDQLTFRDKSPLKLISIYNSTLGSNSCYIPPPKIKRSETQFTFGIKHYAGDVMYNVDQFLEKNTDTLYDDVVMCMLTSRNPFICTLFQPTFNTQTGASSVNYQGLNNNNTTTSSGLVYANDTNVNSKDNKSRRPVSLGSQFKSNLNHLMTKLSVCKPFYVRCIKPNDTKQPNHVEPIRLQHQVKYLGILENIRVRRSGYCYRENFCSFYKRYYMLCNLTWPHSTVEYTQLNLLQNIKNILCGQYVINWDKRLVLDVAANTTTNADSKSSTEPSSASNVDILVCHDNVDYFLGKSKIFIKEPHLIFQLEKRRVIALHHIIVKLQSFLRGVVANVNYKYILKCVRLIQNHIQIYHCKKDLKRKKLHILKVQCLIRRYLEMRKVKKMRIQFRNIPPRIWSRKIQSVVRYYLCQQNMKRNTPELYVKVQGHLNKIKLSKIRYAKSIIIRKYYLRHKCMKSYQNIRKCVLKIQTNYRRKLCYVVRQVMMLREDTQLLYQLTNAQRGIDANGDVSSNTAIPAVLPCRGKVVQVGAHSDVDVSLHLYGRVLHFIPYHADACSADSTKLQCFRLTSTTEIKQLAEKEVIHKSTNEKLTCVSITHPLSLSTKDSKNSSNSENKIYQRSVTLMCMTEYDSFRLVRVIHNVCKSI